MPQIFPRNEQKQLTNSALEWKKGQNCNSIRERTKSDKKRTEDMPHHFWILNLSAQNKILIARRTKELNPKGV